jgi:lipoyl-dependent peroxiredoxin
MPRNEQPELGKMDCSSEKGSAVSHLYTTRVNAYGGRSGTIKSEDGILALPLALPKELGGKGGATNPEQLFAAGYAACFENAVIHVTRAQADKVGDDDIEVACQVSLLPNGEGGFKLAVALDVEIAGIDQDKAEAIVKAAHAVCPYSNAIKGNVEVTLTVFAQ